MSGPTRISSVRVAKALMRSGWSLGGCGINYFLEDEHGYQRGVWLNAALALTKHSDVEQVVFRDDEGARWRLREARP